MTRSSLLPPLARREASRPEGDQWRVTAPLRQRLTMLRRFGAASLDRAWVATGRYDGFWERGLKCWDVAAGALIVREAGGLVCDLAGGRDFLGSGGIIAANGALHETLLKSLRAAAASSE